MTLFQIGGARVDSSTCTRCRKKFNKGDRVCSAYIIDSVGVHPLNMAEIGAYFNEEFELVHIDCRDPDLSKGVLP
jgi:hypothetical protein